MNYQDFIGRDLCNGKYKVTSCLGVFGMSAVYLGVENRLKRPVAIKVLRFDYTNNPYMIRRFVEEAQTAADCQHPNIVVIYDIGEEGNLHYIVMQLLPKSLSSLLKEKKVFDFIEAIKILKPIAQALVYIHTKKKVIHRDIKLSNIMFDEHNNPILTDFGIALREDTTRFADGSSAGTAEYMAPEQIRGQPIDFRADIYSLGIVLYELLTGRTPFQGDDDSVIYYQQIYEPPSEQPLIDNNVPKRVKGIIYKCLAKSPNDRYQSTQELVDAFEDIIRNPPTPKPIRIKRKFTPAIAIPIIIIAVIGIAIVITSVLRNGNGDGETIQPDPIIQPIAKTSFIFLDADVKLPLPYTIKITFKSPNMETTIVNSDSNLNIAFYTEQIEQNEQSDHDNMLKIFLPKPDTLSVIAISANAAYYKPLTRNIKLRLHNMSSETLLLSPKSVVCIACNRRFRYKDTICICGEKRLR